MAPIAAAPGELLSQLEAAASTVATRTSASLADVVSRVRPRQATVTVVQPGGGNNNNSGGSDLSGGAIAGIVIGSVLGFLLLCWLFRYALGAQTSQGHVEPDRPRSSSYYHQDIVADSPHRHRRHSHHHHSRGRRSSRSRSAVRVINSSTTAVPVVEPSRVYYPEKRHHSRRRSSSRY